MIYHSLKMVSEDITGATYDEMANSLTEIDPSMEQILKDKGFIVENDDADDKTLNDCRKEILEPYISTAYFFLTKNCNLACRYCFERQSETKNSSEGVMSFDVFNRGLDFFQRLINLDKDRFNERKTIIFYGGEPFHNKKLLFRQ